MTQAVAPNAVSQNFFTSSFETLSTAFVDLAKKIATFAQKVFEFLKQKTMIVLHATIVWGRNFLSSAGEVIYRISLIAAKNISTFCKAYPSQILTGVTVCFITAIVTWCIATSQKQES